jgi:sulfur-oxidizing protein SoxY
MQLTFDRRQVLALGAGGAVTAVLGFSATPAFAKNDIDEVIGKFTGGKKPAEGRVKLDVPEIAENGNTVPMTVSVDSPMTKDNYVQEVLVVVDGNPRAGVAKFHFSPSTGIAEANTRIRLASTQNLTAIAKMSDGNFFAVTKEVKVTIGGCGG